MKIAKELAKDGKKLKICKVFDFKEHETTEIKKLFESVYPKAKFEVW